MCVASNDVRCDSERISFVFIRPSFSRDFRKAVRDLKEECLMSTGVVAVSAVEGEGMNAGRDGRM